MGDLDQGVGPGGVGVSVLEQVVLGFAEGVVDDHPGLLVGFEMQVEAAVVTEPEPARILNGRDHWFGFDGFGGGLGRFGLVLVDRDRGTGTCRGLALQLAHGEHRGEFGDPMVGPRRCLADDGGHLIERKLTAVERVEALGQFVDTLRRWWRSGGRGRR